MNEVVFGDCRNLLALMHELGIEVDCCVTSPPYWGLRDYGHAGQLGMEETPEVYVQNLVDVFRGVWRILKPSGTLWLNLGDSYNAHPGQRKTTDKAGKKQQSLRGSQSAPSRSVDGLKPKDLIGIPWRVALALQADGWYLRQDIIWHKPNPMPESVTDRCTKSHEYVFLLSKAEKYFYDHEAVKEPAVSEHPSGNGFKRDARLSYRDADGARGNEQPWQPTEKRNRRDVWTIPTKPFKGAHFAVMPEALVEPCILAGCPVGGIVLDPFMGSGTVAVVAKRLGRNYLGCELNPAYREIQEQRLA